MPWKSGLGNRLTRHVFHVIGIPLQDSQAASGRFPGKCCRTPAHPGVRVRYDYVVVGHADAAFWIDFGGLFDTQQSVTYEVVRNGGTVRLRAVNTQGAHDTASHPPIR